MMNIAKLLAVGLLVLSTAQNASATGRFLVSSNPFGGATSGDSGISNPPAAGVAVYFGAASTDNGTCLGCDTPVGVGTVPAFTVSFTAENSPNFATFLSRATSGSAEAGDAVWVALWLTNTFFANIPIGAPVFQNDSSPLLALPTFPVINEVELVIDNYCSGPTSACAIEGSEDTFNTLLTGQLNLYSATPPAVPEPGTYAMVALGLGILARARRHLRS